MTEDLLRYWHAADRLVDRVEETWWGAVVSDPRYPRIHDVNYARVEAIDPVGLGEVEAVLRPVVQRAGARFEHVVIFHLEAQTDLIAEASTRGERLAFDLVMGRSGAPPDPDPRAVAVERHDEEFWSAFRASAEVFGIAEEPVLDQLAALEREVMLPAGRTWFAVRDEGGIVTLGALLVLEGVGFVDGVATLPHARRRGHASALVASILAEAAGRGASATYLLTDPGGPAEGIYRRAGFRAAGRLGSWVSEPQESPRRMSAP